MVRKPSNLEIPGKPGGPQQEQPMKPPPYELYKFGMEQIGQYMDSSELKEGYEWIIITPTNDIQGRPDGVKRMFRGKKVLESNGTTDDSIYIVNLYQTQEKEAYVLEVFAKAVNPDDVPEGQAPEAKELYYLGTRNDMDKLAGSILFMSTRYPIPEIFHQMMRDIDVEPTIFLR